MLHTDFPESLCCSVIGQFKSNRALKLFKLNQMMMMMIIFRTHRHVMIRFIRKRFLSFKHASHLSRPHFDVEVVPLVGDLEYLWPGEAVDAQFISVDEEAAGTNSQHNLHTLRILNQSQINTSLLNNTTTQHPEP